MALSPATWQWQYCFPVSQPSVGSVSHHICHMAKLLFLSHAWSLVLMSRCYVFSHLDEPAPISATSIPIINPNPGATYCQTPILGNTALQMLPERPLLLNTPLPYPLTPSGYIPRNLACDLLLLLQGVMCPIAGWGCYMNFTFWVSWYQAAFSFSIFLCAAVAITYTIDYALFF